MVRGYAWASLGVLTPGSPIAHFALRASAQLALLAPAAQRNHAGEPLVHRTSSGRDLRHADRLGVGQRGRGQRPRAVAIAGAIAGAIARGEELRVLRARSSHEAACAHPLLAWRVAEVPAASHPSVAAALAWVAEGGFEDRVWDPFCGSGAELIERARRGPCRSLLGTDLDRSALAAARRNLDAAGLQAKLVLADARSHAAGPVDLVITNPPLGSRMRVDATALLVDSLPNLARQLAPRGRLVWITPAQGKTTPVAERLKLRRVRALGVDLGGVRGQLERWDAP